MSMLGQGCSMHRTWGCTRAGIDGILGCSMIDGYAVGCACIACS